VAPNSPDLNLLDYHIWDAMLEKYHKFQPKPKMTDELKVALQSADHMGRAAKRTHKQGSPELQEVLDCLHGCICQWWSFRASAVTLYIFRSATSSYHQQTGSFHSHR